MNGKLNVMWIFLIIIGIAAFLYLIGFFLKRRNESKLDELEKRKIELFDLPVIEEVDEVKKMHLVGQSQNTFREWNQKWIELSTTSFAELESRIFDAENLNETFRFVKVKKAIEEANETMDEMEVEVESIRTGLKELRESEERNSLKVQQALDVYEEVNQILKDQASTFGPSIKELQKQIKRIETEFTQFVSLNTSGDPIEAREVLEQAEEHTYEIENIIQRIPEAYNDLHKIYPEQVKEIKEGYDKLVKEHYVFPEKNLAEDIKKVSIRIQNTLSDLEKCEIDSVELNSREIAETIDDFYAVMEREIAARSYVQTNQKTVREFLVHALKNNRQLMIELDHTSQSYALTHNELGRSRGFQAQIEELQKKNEEYDLAIKNKSAIFSEVEQFYRDIFQILDEVENQQVEIDSSLQELRKGEKIAQEKIDAFEFKMRTMKRYVEKQRLPGLSDNYLEFFFVATDRIEELGRELNKIRIDMEQINRLVELCGEDIQLLEDKTNDLVDSAALTEQMMQYSNRYRHTHAGIREAIERSLELFNKEYRYQDALDEIGTALERVEPGAFQRIESFYYNNRELV